MGTKIERTDSARVAIYDKVNTIADEKQDKLVSGTNIKTVNGNNVLGAGDLIIATGDNDNISITKNSSDKLQTIGVINQNATSTAIKTWTGTKAQYDSLSTKDSNTLYAITDYETDIYNDVQTTLGQLYPVGTVYTNATNTSPSTSLGVGSWNQIGTATIGSTTVYYWQRIS